MASLPPSPRFVADTPRDVVEDTDLKLGELAAEGFHDYILVALDSVTRRAGETYEAFVARAAKNAIGRRVKYADLQDNADLSCILAPTDADQARTAKYHRAMAQLKAERTNQERLRHAT